ncbi:tetratricopeptide repeat protein [Streptomyces sp. NPDC088910]|uniref:tetratricopeptide repeat protein n=1 Tax=Streptomyces sp. NPDC088910 TaxID=3365911 RepID=UPI003805A373
MEVISARRLAELSARRDEARAAWRELGELVSSPVPERPASPLPVSSASAELRALERAPGDLRRAQALSVALAERAAVDPDFRAGLDDWPRGSRDEPNDPASAPGSASDVANHVHGGTFFSAVFQGRDITVQVPRETPLAGSGLPVRAANFTGRDEQLAELLDLLRPRTERHDGPVAAVVTGLAGVGKTELVLQAAARATAEPGWFPGGVLFADLLGYDRDLRLLPERVLGPWLSALGIADADIPADPRARVALYRSVLAACAEHGRRVLVVIDNASSADEVLPLLPGDGRNAALVTSRHTLDVGARLCELDVLAADASVDLIRNVLRQARGPHDTRVADEPDDALRIAEYCGRLPLALRICSALLADTPGRPLASLAQALADAQRRLDHLTREDRAVRAAFDLSHQHLEQVSPACARLFRLLPLNSGPDIGTSAAAHLCGADETTAEVMLRDLARAHLIEPARTWGRWRMHGLVRLYADERGAARADADQAQAALARLMDYYVRTAVAADAHLKGPVPSPAPLVRDRAQALSWLEDEFANLICAAAFATGLGHPAVPVALSYCLAEFCSLRLHFEEMTLLAAVALPVCRWTGDRAAEGWAQHLLGLSVLLPGREQEAVEPFRTAASLFREAGADDNEASALTYLALALAHAGRAAEAEEANQRALAIHRRTGDRAAEGRAVVVDSARLTRTGQDDEAVAALRKGLLVCRESGDRFGEGRLLGFLGLVHGRNGQEEQGIEALEQAVSIFRDIGDRRVEGEIQGDIGEALVRVGRFAQALRALEEAAACAEESGSASNERRRLAAHGAALHWLGRYDEAEKTLRRALAVRREEDDEPNQAVLLDSLGATLLAARRYEEAADHLRQAIALSRKAGARAGEAESQNRLGLALSKTGQEADATAAFRRALAVFRERGDSEREAIVLTNLGSHLLASGHPAEADLALRQAMTLCQKLGDIPVKSVAATLLLASRLGGSSGA